MVSLVLACVPHLYSDAEVWIAPANGWPAGEVPVETVGEGFGVGEIIPELVGPDQYGDDVSLWQFYGLVTVVDISTIWCGPCQELARTTQETYEVYADDDVMYVTVLAQDLDGQPPEVDDLQFWADEFGISAPVIGDQVEWWLGASPDQSFPQIMVLYPDLRVCTRDIEAKDAALRDAIDGCL
ncbi:MAG TPA: hypothetical protein QGF58_04650 [Myxococcota bacterium]|nr:hypothetical protein [Myxococcota bacterium]